VSGGAARPPTPHGRGEVSLEPRVLLLWRLRAGAVGAVTAAVVLVVSASTIGALPAAVTTAGFLLVCVAAVWWWTGLVWRAWGFRVGERALHLRHGVFVRKVSAIPFHRVQHIDIESGPLERRLGLATFVLRTASASSDSTVPALDAGHAEELRERILSLVGSGDAT
jgi:uncharacterized protein